MVVSKRFEMAKRVKDLPPYLFAAIDRKKREAIAKGIDILNLGIGDPDLPTPAPIIRRLNEAAKNPQNHQYPSCEGMMAFRQEAAKWIEKQYGVSLDPAKEVLTLIGSKEGVGHLPLAFINPGDVSLIPDPGYPVYAAGTLFAGGKSYLMPLHEKNGFLPDFSKIPVGVLNKARLLFLNYPGNPTSAVADRAFFETVVRFARKHQLIVCHDAAYSEIYFDGQRPVSFLEVKGAKEVGIEIHSLSKTFNMTGWRIGFAVGNARVLEGLAKIKSNLDSGAFQAVQEAGIEALSRGDKLIQGIRQVYQERRDILVSGLQKLGIEAFLPKATFFVWMKVPKGSSSTKFTSLLLSKAGIVTTPGSGFGPSGEGYIRMALTVKKERLQEALRRMEKIL